MRQLLYLKEPSTEPIKTGNKDIQSATNGKFDIILYYLSE